MRGFPAVVAAAVGLVLAAVSTTAGAQEAVTVGIDVDPSGNQANSLGKIDSCRTVNAGESFQVDVFVKGIPPAEGFEKGLSGFGFDFMYDPAVLRVTAIDANQMLAAAGSRNPFEIVDDLPDSDGDFRVDEADLSRNFESGDGVLLRITLEAVGTGQSTLSLDDSRDPSQDHLPDIFGGAGIPQYDIALLQNAAVAVGGSCTAPTPVVPPGQDGGENGGTGGEATPSPAGGTGGAPTGASPSPTGPGVRPGTSPAATGSPAPGEGAGEDDGGGLGSGAIIAIVLGASAAAIAAGAGGWFAWRRFHAP